MPSSGSGTMAKVSSGGVGTGYGVAAPVTLLPLVTYAKLMSIPLPHFQQMNGAQAPLTKGCDKVWDQDARDLLAWTMQQAEELIVNELGFYPVPTFITDELHLFQLAGVRNDWYNAELKTKYSFVEGYGTEQLTLVQANATVEYMDLDNDPFERQETAEIGNAVYADLPACARACDVAVFFRVADGAEDAADPRYEIRPLKVDIDGSTMRIRADSSLFVRPDLWRLTEMNCRGSTDQNKWRLDFALTNLVSQVDVYCRTINTQTPVTLRWDGACSCTDVCSHKTQTACAYPTSNRNGYFAPRAASWNGSANVFASPTYRQPPESVIVNYRAGYPLDRNCQMDANLQRAIIKLTNVLLPEPPCGFCDQAQIRWDQDRKDIDPLTPEAASMPWDLYKRGALEAWRIVKKFARGRGGKLGR